MDVEKHQSKGGKSKSKAGKSGGRTKSGKSSSKSAKQKSNEEKSKAKAFKSAKQQSKEETSKSKAFKSGGPGAAKAGKPNSDSASSTGHASDMDDGIGSAAGVSSAPTPKVSTNSPTNDPNERMNTPRPSSARPTPNPTPVPSPAVVLARANIPPPTPPAPKPILVDVENYPLLVETLRPTLPGALRSSPGTASVLSDGETGGGPLGVGAMVGIIISALAVVGAAGLVLASRSEDVPRQEAATVDDTVTQPDLEAETDHVDEGGGGA